MVSDLVTGLSTALAGQILRFSAGVPAHAPCTGAVVGERDIGSDLEAEAFVEPHVRLAGGLQERRTPSTRGLLDARNQYGAAEALPLGLRGGSHGLQKPPRLLGPVRGHGRVRHLRNGGPVAAELGEERPEFDEGR